MSEWLEALPEELRDAPFIGKAENVEDALGKLAHAAQYMGQAIKLPGDDATDEQKAEFFEKLGDVPGYSRIPGLDDIEGQVALLEKLGAPAEAKDYELPALDEFEWDENIGGDLKNYAKEAGLTKAQFAKFASLIGGQEQAVASESSHSQQEARKALKEAWGDSLEERENLIRGWMEKSDAPEEMVGMLNDQNLPLASMEWLHSVAKQFKGEVTPIHKDGAGQSPTLDTAQARARIQEILNHPAYFDAASPLHRDMVKEMMVAQKLANPAKEA